MTLHYGSLSFVWENCVMHKYLHFSVFIAQKNKFGRHTICLYYNYDNNTGYIYSLLIITVVYFPE